MDNETYEQVELNTELVGEAKFRSFKMAWS